MQREAGLGAKGAMRLIAVVEAARQLAVSTDFIYDEIRLGRLEAIRLGTRVVIEQEALNRYVDERRTAGPATADRGPERGVRLVSSRPKAVGRRGVAARRPITN